MKDITITGIRFSCVAVIVSFSALAAAYAQTTFQRTFGGWDRDVGSSVQETAEGGYIIAGHTYSFGEGGSDVYLIKTNADGETLWTATFGGDGSDRAYSIQQSPDGGYIVAGYTSSFGAGSNDVYLIKTNGDGDSLWTRTFGGSDVDEGWSVQQTTDGGFVITGRTRSFGAGEDDVYLIKTDRNGDTLWTKTFGESRYDGGNAVLQTTDGGYVVTGYTIPSRNPFISDAYLIKTDGDGSVLWTKTIGHDGFDDGSSVQQTTDGGYIVAGSSSSYAIGKVDFYLVKTNADGDTLWTRLLGASSRDNIGYSVDQTADGGYIVTGSTSSDTTNDAVYLIRTDPHGDTLWTTTFGGGYAAAGYSVQQTTDGGYIIAGHTRGDVYLIKTDRDGRVVTVKEIDRASLSFSLSQNYPNPFNATSVIGYSLQTVSRVRLSVYDILGQEVATLLNNEHQEAGTHEVHFDAGMLSSGAYFYKLTTSANTQTRKMILMK